MGRHPLWVVIDFPKYIGAAHKDHLRNENVEAGQLLLPPPPRQQVPRVDDRILALRQPVARH